MKIIASIVVILMSLFTQPVLAIQVSGLYQATVAVSTEASGERVTAIKKALVSVLIKLTGDRSISTRSGTDVITEQAERLVQQFRYRYGQTKTDRSSVLWVQFDEAALNKILREYGIHIWGRIRPSILVWLVSEQDGTRSLVSMEQGADYLTSLEKAAGERGIALLFPLLDLEDTASMNVSDLWGEFKEPILTASERYQADIVVVGKLKQLAASRWKMDWTAYMQSDDANWNNQGEFADSILQAGINRLADEVAIRYANTGSTGSTGAEVLELSVVDVGNLNQYAKVLTYLQSLQSVNSVMVKKVTENEVYFEVISHGGQTAIDQAVSLGKTLVANNTPDKLSYRLIQR